MPDEPLLPSPPRLPRPPRIALEVARDRTADSRATGGFVNVRRVDLVARYPDGTRSAPFPYDVVERAPLDAAIVVAYEMRGAERWVYVRTATRAPLVLRDSHGTDETSRAASARAAIEGDAQDVQAHDHLHHLWEVPAGLIEAGESPAQAAARELEEELGFRVAASSLVELGTWTLPLPAVIAERQFHFGVDVTHAERSTPTEDGSALERAARITVLPLASLLAACREGRLRDAKSELALRRLAELS